MVHAPLRGLFFLGRTATVLVAAAAGAYILRKNRRLAEQVGDSLIKAGENLRGEAKAAAEPKTSEPVKQSEKSKPKSTRSAAKKPAAKPTAPKAAAKRTAKPAPKRPTKPKTDSPKE